MAVETLKRLWKNEYIQTAITIALMFLIVFGLYFSAQAVLGTEYPALAVASGSMLPTLNIGDLIIVQKVDPSQIHADPNGLTGDILVYRSGDGLIVHRAVNIRRDVYGVYWITTRGDNSVRNDTEWNSNQLVGKVIARIPYLGNLPLFLHTERNMYIIFFVLIIILVIMMMPFGFVEEIPREEKRPAWKWKAPIKIDLNLALYIFLNILIIGFMGFSLWGSFTFWQPGANPTYATVRGMYADLQFHESFIEVDKAYLSLGFLTYKIDYNVNGETRFGVQTFSWFQFSLLILILFNAWKLFNLIKHQNRKIESSK